MLRETKENNNAAVIITAAQNDTPVHKQAFQSLETYAQKLGAELIVLPIKYNKKAFSAAVESADETFAVEVLPYFEPEPFTVHNAVVYSNCHILPTAKYPVNAAIDLNDGERYSIVASPKIQQKELPRLQGQSPMTCLTTGAITIPNYLQSRAGSVAEKSHKIGAILLTGGIATNLEYDKTLGWAYNYQAIVLGDIHAEQLDGDAFERALNLINLHDIRSVVLHDLFDCLCLNEHERYNDTHNLIYQDRTIKNDLDCAKYTLERIEAIPSVKEILVVRSNHDDMLNRWLQDERYNPRHDLKNIVKYHELQAQRYQYIQERYEEPNMLELALDYKHARFLDLNTSVKLFGVEIANHGHKGVNGSRSGLQKTGQKMIIGHSHTSGRIDDFVQVGCTCKLQQGYNAGGGSTWTQQHALICSSGRITLV